MSRNYLQGWEFREQVSRDLYPEDFDCESCPLATPDSCLALVCSHRDADADTAGRLPNPREAHVKSSVHPSNTRGQR